MLSAAPLLPIPRIGTSHVKQYAVEVWNELSEKTRKSRIRALNTVKAPPKEGEEEAEYWGYKIQETYFLSRLLDLGVLSELLREGQSVAQDRSIYEDQIFTKNSNNREYITDQDYRRYLDLFNLYRGQGNTDRAVEMLRKGTERHPDSKTLSDALDAATRTE